MASRPPLTRDEVHVWRIGLGGGVEGGGGGEAFLSTVERERLADLRPPGVRRRYVARTSALRVLLSGYVGVTADRVRIEREKGGRPRLDHEGAPDFSLSHSGERAVVAVSRGGPVGIDLERVDPRVDVVGIAGRFFAPSERERIEAAPEGARTTLFFRIWTLKEAVLKAVGVGLSAPLDGVVVDPGRDRPRLLAVPPDLPPPDRWSLAQWEAEPGYVAALAAPRPGVTTRTLTWPAPDPDGEGS